MHSWQEIISEQNSIVLHRYESTMDEIKRISSTSCAREHSAFFKGLAQKLVFFSELEKKLTMGYFNSSTLSCLKEQNDTIYKELYPNGYETSFADPSYCVKLFGNNIGQLLSYVYSGIFDCHGHALNHKIYRLYEYAILLLRLHEYASSTEVTYEGLKAIVEEHQKDEKKLQIEARVMLLERFSHDYSYTTDIILKSDLSDPRYLFKYDMCITENEIKMAKFISTYPKQEIDKLAGVIVDAYIRSFIRDNKSPSSRRTVYIIYAIGNEVLVRAIIHKLEAKGYKTRAHWMLLSTNINSQYDYDHKFDNSILIDKDYLDAQYKVQLQLFEEYKDMLADCSGNIVFRSFGEKPFSPSFMTENLKMDDIQTQLFQKHNMNINRVYNNYIKRDETSFTIIALPSPEIGHSYEAIFKDILAINYMDNSTHELIQQKIIDALDMAEYVHVKGCGNNVTDLKVYLKELANPLKETKFYNSTAEVNIPVGEVYTSPMLTGTTGLLHLEEVFLRGFNYKNLKLAFEDGYITEYSCSNFDSEEENKRYIYENMLFPNEALPMGEFAIGTNTKAYVMAKRHNIVSLLPILIVEKMGPHFAIGDTCFKNEEDIPVYNMLDGKEMIARENEKTALRKSDPDNAYTYKHMDITIPYDDLLYITAVGKDGAKTDIIRDGRFVLAGTNALNIPFQNID